jgi:hypothetical protein
VSELGDILRSVRQKKGATISEVAAATRIKEPYLEALEAGEYQMLPGPAYITGFLRNYARYLGLHPDDIVQEYYATRPLPQPTVKAATRVLANGHNRQHRTRLYWTLATVVLLVAGAFAIKQYNDTYAHPFQPQLNVTAASLGAPTPIPTAPPRHRVATRHLIRLQLRAIAPVWLRVTADGRRKFQGILRRRQPVTSWTAQRAIYVVTYDGAHLKVTFDGRHLGRMTRTPGLVVYVATPTGWRGVS